MKKLIALTIFAAASLVPAPNASANAWQQQHHKLIQPLSAEQIALSCYTDYGVFPMVNAVPVGAACFVRLPVWPFNVVRGVAGY